MPKSKLLLYPKFLEQASNLSKEKRDKLFKCLKFLCIDYLHPGLKTKKIKGGKNFVFECRVDRGIRLIYDLYEDYIRCWYVGEHDFTIKIGGGLEVSIDDVEFIKKTNPVFPIYLFIDIGEISQKFFEIELDRLVL